MQRAQRLLEQIDERVLGPADLEVMLMMVMRLDRLVRCAAVGAWEASRPARAKRRSRK